MGLTDCQHDIQSAFSFSLKFASIINVEYGGQELKAFGPLSTVSADERGGRYGSVTVYGEETNDFINGKNIKVVEVRGEKSNSHEMVKQKKGSKSSDKLDLNIACLNLGKSDHEGWLSKKGGHGIVRWKRKWCVLKDSKLYLYDTSFDKAADNIYNVKEYTVVDVEEKKKCAFGLKPSSTELKTTVFCGEKEDVDTWKDILKKLLSGVDISKDEDNVPDYEERKRVFSSTDAPKITKQPSKRHSAFQKETETTGMPATFKARQASISRSRSLSGKNDTTVLAVGSMFKPLEEDEDTPALNGSSGDMSYKEVEGEVFTSTVVVEEEEEKIDGRKPSNELETLIKEVEQLKAGTYKREQSQDKLEPKVGEVETKTTAVPEITETTTDVTSDPIVKPSVPDSLESVTKDWEETITVVTTTTTETENKESEHDNEGVGEGASKEVTLSSELFYTGAKEETKDESKNENENENEKGEVKNENDKNENEGELLAESTTDVNRVEEDIVNVSVESDVFAPNDSKNDDSADSLDKSHDVIDSNVSTTEISDVTEGDSEDPDLVFREPITEVTVTESALDSDTETDTNVTETETETETEVTSSEVDEPLAVTPITSPSDDIDECHSSEVDESSPTAESESTLRHSLRACFADTDVDTAANNVDVVVHDQSDNCSTSETSPTVDEPVPTTGEINDDDNANESTTPVIADTSIQSTESSESAQSATSVESVESAASDQLTDIEESREISDSLTVTTTTTTVDLDDSLKLPSPISPLASGESLLDAVMKVSRGSSLTEENNNTINAHAQSSETCNGVVSVNGFHDNEVQGSLETSVTCKGGALETTVAEENVQNGSMIEYI